MRIFFLAKLQRFLTKTYKLDFQFAVFVTDSSSKKSMLSHTVPLPWSDEYSFHLFPWRKLGIINSYQFLCIKVCRSKSNNRNTVRVKKYRTNTCLLCLVTLPREREKRSTPKMLIAYRQRVKVTVSVKKQFSTQKTEMVKVFWLVLLFFV